MTIYTGDVYAGGTDSNVWLGLNGVYGSETKKVDKDMAAMDRGSADALKYDLYIGDIHSISIDKDGSGVFEEWYLTKVVFFFFVTSLVSFSLCVSVCVFLCVCLCVCHAPPNFQ